MTLQTPLVAQNGEYPAVALRDLIALSTVNQGTVGDGDLAVTPGAGRSVDIAAGIVVVPSSTVSRGSYLCHSTSVENVALAAAPGAGSSRFDLIVATVADSEYGDPATEWRVEAVTGAASGTPLVPSLPANSITLAIITVGSEVTTILSGAINDRRQHARAVTYSSRLPSVAPDGQIVVTPAGSVVTRVAGVWTALPLPSQFGAALATMPATALVQSSEYGTYADVSVPMSAGQVLVNATFTGLVAGSEASSSVADTYIEVSMDGGSTWVASPQVITGSSRTVTNVKIVVGTPSGQIRARLRARPSSAIVATVSGSLVLSKQPA